MHVVALILLRIGEINADDQQRKRLQEKGFEGLSVQKVGAKLLRFVDKRLT